MQWLTAANAGLRAAQAAGDPAAEAAMRACLGDAARAAHDYAEAIEQFTAALELAGRAGDEPREAALMSNIGLTHFEAGDLNAAGGWLLRGRGV